MNNERSEKIEFPGAMGKMLAARLDLPAGEPLAYALFAHCFTCSKEIYAAARVSAALTAHGIGVLRFDFTGLGSSEGEFANTNFTSNTQDILQAAAYLREHHQAPKILIGHSFGGAAMLAVAGQIEEAVAVATIGAPSDPAHVTHLFEGKLEEIEQQGSALVRLAGRPFTISQQFVEDIAEQKMTEAIGEMRKALLIFHAPLDGIVGVENAARIFRAAKHPKSFVSLDDADHLLSRRVDAEYVAQVISSWASRYLGEAAKAHRPRVVAENGYVTVAETGEGKFANAVAVGEKHYFLADEPLAAGGTDTGPGPYDFLMAGLGSCTAMTLRMYAEHKGLPLDRVTVTLHHGKIHAKDCRECESTTGRVDRIDRQIKIEGPELTDAERARLLEIADKCPVHKTLHSEVLIVTEAAE
ncbi:MAG: alpha/beta fold hydrolase [Magnetospiraceae bacterium]